jgi:hypothetical protein
VAATATTAAATATVPILRASGIRLVAAPAVPAKGTAALSASAIAAVAALVRKA